MGRLTIILDDDLHQALKETAARQGRSIGSIVEESVRLRGIGTEKSPGQIVAQARKRAGLATEKATATAVTETRRARR